MSTEPSSLHDQRGLTLIELIVFIVIVSVALIGLLTVMNVTVTGSADPMLRKQSLAIAEALLEEVAAQPFTYCDPDDTANAGKANIFISGGTVDCTASYIESAGPETISSTESRGNVTPAFDNVNDYSGISSANLQTDISRNYAIPTGYTASMTVTATDTIGPAGLQITSSATPANMRVLRIGVTVTRGTESITLEGYRTRYAPNT